MVLIDRKTHERFHQLDSVAARYFRIPIEMVKTGHIAKVTNIIYSIVSRLCVDPETKVLKTLEQIVAEFSEYLLPEDDPFVLQIGSGGKRLKEFK